jgi:hypothetical protein
MLPIAIIATNMPSMESHLRRRAGVTRKITRASTAPPPAPSHGKMRGRSRAALVVVPIETVAVPLVEFAVRVTGAPTMHVGSPVAPEGELARAQERVTVPAYPEEL